MSGADMVDGVVVGSVEGKALESEEVVRDGRVKESEGGVRDEM
jgi:hypothetical protein